VYSSREPGKFLTSRKPNGDYAEIVEYHYARPPNDIHRGTRFLPPFTSLPLCRTGDRFPSARGEVKPLLSEHGRSALRGLSREKEREREREREREISFDLAEFARRFAPI